MPDPALTDARRGESVGGAAIDPSLVSGGIGAPCTASASGAEATPGVREQALAAARRAGSFATERPFVSMAVAAGLGAVLGWLVKR